MSVASCASNLAIARELDLVTGNFRTLDSPVAPCCAEMPTLVGQVLAQQRRKKK
jgi:hypothetical protein